MSRRPRKVTGLVNPDPYDEAAQERAEEVERRFKMIWVEYAAQRLIIQQLRRYMRTNLDKRGVPLDGRRLSQHSQAGKSALIERLKVELAEEDSKAGLSPNPFRLVHVTLDKRISLKMFYQKICRAMGDQFANEPDNQALRASGASSPVKLGRKSDNTEILEQRIAEWVVKLGVEVLVIDEIQRLSRKDDEAGDVTVKLQAFIDRGVVPIVLVGDDTSQKFFEVNQQFAARLGRPLKLEPLTDRGPDLKLFKKFCQDFNAALLERNAITIGDFVIPRVYLDFERRGIALEALCKDEYHRVNWLNVLLPYDADTGERLVDTCGFCNAPLGWRNAHGIGTCETCWQQIEPSAEAKLDPENADHYRMFAALFSLVRSEAGIISKALPPDLRSVSPETLHRLCLLVGGLARPEPVASANSRIVAELSAPVIADVVACGMQMIIGWPKSLRDWIDDRTGSLADSPAELRAFRESVQRLVKRTAEARELVEVVAAALPGLQKHPAHGYAETERYYLRKKVQKLYGLAPEQMTALDGWAGLRRQELTTARQRHFHYDADQVDGMLPAFRETVALNSCRDVFGVPVYGLEQLVGTGRLEGEDHPAVRITKAARQIRGRSVEELKRALCGARSKAERPKDTVTLSLASKRVGGRAKPWCAIVEALLAGDLPFWLLGEDPTTTSIAVRMRDAEIMDALAERSRLPAGFVPDSGLSQSDAGELLNIHPKLVNGVADRFGLEISVRSSAFGFSREGLLSIAKHAAWASEIGCHLGAAPQSVAQRLKDDGIPSEADGHWARPRLIAEGILPSAPLRLGTI